jgi:hypothetical protein
MATADSLTAARLREVLSYDPDTGIFTWMISTGPRAKVGAVAGTLGKDGYIRIKVDGRKYLAHRLARLYVFGVWPEAGVDHRDGVGSNNWIKNLRVATQALNMQNQRKARSNNKCGLLGVSPNGDLWKARIVVDGVHEYLGTFGTPEQAHTAYLAAKALHHPFQTLVTPAGA